MKNLEYVEAAGWEDARVHVSTARVLALIGLVGFPYEKGTTKKFADELSGMFSWPRWNIEVDTYPEKTTTLAGLLKHIRNAVAHGRIEFSSNDPDPNNVEITFKDRNPKCSSQQWEAAISSNSLLKFCRLLSQQLGV